MRSLSSSMTFKLLRSAVGLHSGEHGGASAERHHPHEARFKRCVQRVALQQENECRSRKAMQGDIAPVLHHTDTPLARRLPCQITLHVVSFSVVGPVMGAENWRPFCGPGFGGWPEANPSSTLPKLSLVRSSEVSF